MTGAALVPILNDVADRIAAALRSLDDWSPAGTIPGQYRSDLAADEVAVAALLDEGLGVLSEESGRHAEGREITVVVDPLDGSTNAHRRVPWFATSLCAVDAEGPLAAVVIDLASGRRYDAVRGGGARCDDVSMVTSAVDGLGDAIVGLSGLPDRHLGWKQFRALGAAALDLCAVGEGILDGYVDCSVDAHGPWDYLGGMLVCQEAGGTVVDAHGRDLVVLDHAARRTPVAGASPALVAELVAARNMGPG